MVKFIKENYVSVLSMLMIVVAAVLGADCSFAMGEVTLTGNSGGFDTKAPEGTPDSVGLNTQHQGEGATASAAREAGLEVEEIDQIIANFRPFRFPLEWFITNKMNQQTAKSYEQTHYKSGATELEAVYAGSAVSGSGTFAQKNVRYTLPIANFESGAENIHEYDTVMVEGVAGYADDGATIDGNLILFIVKNDGVNIIGQAINPKSTALQIPQGAKLIVLGNACSESQMVVDPETYLPVADTLYLQKKIANIVMTDEWLEQARKVQFITKDVVNNGIYNHKRKCARSHWLGRQFKTQIKVADAKIGQELVYFERGILRQINMSYTFANGNITWDDLIALSKMMFTDNAANTSAVALCGKNAMQSLLQLAANVDVNRNLSYERVEEMGVSVHKWTDGFGTLEFIQDPTLNDIGYADAIVILDLANAVHYVKKMEVEVEQDLSKTGEAREAKRRIITTIDCVGLKGYNSVICLPASQAGKIATLGGVTINAVSSATIPTESLTHNQLVYLTAANGAFAAGTLIQYDSVTNTWSEYSGVVEA